MLLFIHWMGIEVYGNIEEAVVVRGAGRNRAWLAMAVTVLIFIARWPSKGQGLVSQRSSYLVFGFWVEIMQSKWDAGDVAVIGFDIGSELSHVEPDWVASTFKWAQFWLSYTWQCLNSPLHVHFSEVEKWWGKSTKKFHVKMEMAKDLCTIFSVQPS